MYVSPVKSLKLLDYKEVIVLVLGSPSPVEVYSLI